MLRALFGILIFKAMTAQAQIRCEAVFAGALPLFAASEIQILIQRQAELFLKIEQDKARGSSSLLQSALIHDAGFKRQELLDYFKTYKIMDAAEFQARFKAEIIRLQSGQKKSNHDEKKKKNEQKDIIKEALDPSKFANKMTFHKIRPGKFMMGEIEEQIETEITKPFEMMATPVTQMMWARVKIAMGEENLERINPSFFKTGSDSAIITIEGLDVQMNADHPVEKVTWNDIQEYINGLNQLSKSSDAKTQKLLEELIRGHKKGDVYNLPTEAQSEFVMRDRGNANKKYFDRDDESDVQNYAWLAENSGNQTHAVATLRPRMIDGKAFYDLEGNVFEWNQDRYDKMLQGGKDPKGHASALYRVVRGGSWDTERQTLRSGRRTVLSPGSINTTLGFRLVRTRP